MALPPLHLLSLRPPDGAVKYLATVCRLRREVLGTSGNSTQVPLPAGTLVEIISGGYIAEPEFDDDHYRFTARLVTATGAVDPRYISVEGLFPELLDIEPGIAAWTLEDSMTAVGQGWEVFDCDGSDGPPWQLQAVVDADRFADDAAAAAFVWRQATERQCPTAQRALAFLYQRCPEEYASVREAARRVRENERV